MHPGVHCLHADQRVLRPLLSRRQAVQGRMAKGVVLSDGVPRSTVARLDGSLLPSCTRARPH